MIITFDFFIKSCLNRVFQLVLSFSFRHLACEIREYFFMLAILAGFCPDLCPPVLLYVLYNGGLYFKDTASKRSYYADSDFF